MNKKIIVIFLGILLMSSYIVVAHDVDRHPVMKLGKQIEISADDDTQPIWDLGDEWIYKIDDIDMIIEQGAQLSVFLNANIGELPITVYYANTDTYWLKFNAPIDGSLDFMGILPIGLFNISGELINTKISGDIIINKADIGIKHIHILLEGKISLEVKEIPIELPFPIIPTIPIPLEIELDMDLNNTYPVIDFPVNIGKNWGLPSTNLSLTGTIKSTWLEILGYINDFLKYPGVIPLLAKITDQPEELLYSFSDILSNLTPVIDIEYALNEYLGGRFFEFPRVPPVFYCISKENITVADETFNSYNVSLINGLANLYYHNEVGNILGIYGNFNSIIPFINNINARLISYRHTK